MLPGGAVPASGPGSGAGLHGVLLSPDRGAAAAASVGGSATGEAAMNCFADLMKARLPDEGLVLGVVEVPIEWMVERGWSAEDLAKFQARYPEITHFLSMQVEVVAQQREAGR